MSVMDDLRADALAESWRLRDGLPPAPPEQFTATLALSCGSCGHPSMRVVTRGRVVAFQAGLILACRACRREQQLLVRLLDCVGETTTVQGPRVLGRNAECGTDPGYYRHVRAKPKQDACDDCKAAHARAEAERKARRAPSTPEVTAELAVRADGVGLWAREMEVA